MQKLDAIRELYASILRKNGIDPESDDVPGLNMYVRTNGYTDVWGRRDGSGYIVNLTVLRREEDK